MPDVTPDKVDAKFSVLLEVVVEALVTAVAPPMIVDSPTLIDIGPAKASVSPLPTGLAASATKVIAFVVVEETVPMIAPVVSS